MLEHNFGKIKTLLEAPELTVLQRRSYDKFLYSRIQEILEEFSPVRDYNENLYLYFSDSRFIMPSLSSRECMDKGLTYAARLMVTCRLENKMTGEIKESEVCFGEIPVMCEDDTFIRKGVKCVIVSQIVRSPGIYYTLNKKSNAYRIVEGTILPNQGAWLELLNDKSDMIYITLNKQKRILITQFLRVMGFGEEEIKEIITEKYYNKALEKDKLLTYADSLKELFVKTKPGEPYSSETAKKLVETLYYAPERYSLKEVGRYKMNLKTGLDIPLDTDTLTKEDIVEFIKGYIKVLNGEEDFDDIDHLGNRRIKVVGELIEEKFKSGLDKVIKTIKEQISVKGTDNLTPSSIINPRALQTTVQEFFSRNQLALLLESTNLLSETNNKRRISAIGKGGVNKERAGMEVRDVHYSHYGRICHIETPDGANIGLITSLAMYADLDKYGFITTPYRKIDKANKKILEKVDYINAAEEEKLYVAQIDIKVDEDGNILDKFVKARHKGETVIVPIEMVDYMDVSPVQTLSVSATMIPFLHNDDATRAGMGCNMQRQAVPLIQAEAPLVGTGAEKILGREYTKRSDVSGKVIYVDCDRIDIKTEDNIKSYELTNFVGTKKNTCIRETPIVKIGDEVKIGDPLFYKYCLDKENGKLSLGRNVVVAYMPWEGYNYEDSVLISDRLVREDIYTSLHMEKHEVKTMNTKLGPEEFTNDILGLSTAQKQKLDDDGFVKIGTKVESGDILVGKVTPKGNKDLTPEGKLMRAIFGSKCGEVKNTSYKLKNGGWGTVIKVQKYTQEDDMDLGAGVKEVAKITIAKKRKIQFGDKMAGRHGNKGVVSRVLPDYEMPYLPDGTPVDILLNPMGVPSRMNIGQILEVHLGMAARELGLSYVIPAFDGPSTEEIKEELLRAGLPEDGKTILYDGRTGEPFDEKVTVGVGYMLRLSHLVDEKIHARSIGNYSVMTQQPLGGRAQFGGQRFGEMEVWALEGYGAAHTLQEMLTIKSDDIAGREGAVRAILDGEDLPEPRLPESYKILDRQLKALGFKVTINGIDNLTHSTEEDLVEKRYVFDKAIGDKISPWKNKKDGDYDDEDEDFDYDDEEDIIDDDNKEMEDDFLLNDTDDDNIGDFDAIEMEYLEKDSISDIE